MYCELVGFFVSLDIPPKMRFGSQNGGNTPKKIWYITSSRCACSRSECISPTFSFIGWRLLSALTLGIGDLWLNPYVSAATSAFQNHYVEVGRTYNRKISKKENLKI